MIATSHLDLVVYSPIVVEYTIIFSVYAISCGIIHITLEGLERAAATGIP